MAHKTARTVLFSTDPHEATEFVPAILTACAAAGVPVAPATPRTAPEEIDYIVFTPAGPIGDFSPYSRACAALSLWAGVERITGNPTLTIPLCRMVDPGLTSGMVEYVTAQVLRLHLGLDALISGQDGVWRNDLIPPVAASCRVGMLGLGELGSACAVQLAALGFDVAGWSRRGAGLPGIRCYTDRDGLHALLARSDILVTLLPATPQTENVLNEETLALLPAEACIINPGRGSLIDDGALLKALNNGRLGHATLDVFRSEPLPPEHPFWQHPKVTVTPHIAAATRPETAAPVIAENIRRAEAGVPLLHQVDRAAGY